MNQWNLYVDEDGDFAFGQEDHVMYTTTVEDEGGLESSVQFLKRWQDPLDKWTAEEAEDHYRTQHIYTGSFEQCWSHYQRMRGYL